HRPRPRSRGRTARALQADREGTRPRSRADRAGPVGRPAREHGRAEEAAARDEARPPPLPRSRPAAVGGDAVTSAKDPVCGMGGGAGEPPGGSAEHGGTTYWFCNPRCRERLVADPEKFLVPKTGAAAESPITVAPSRWSSRPLPTAAATDTRTYTCPMHP